MFYVIYDLTGRLDDRFKQAIHTLLHHSSAGKTALTETSTLLHTYERDVDKLRGDIHNAGHKHTQTIITHVKTFAALSMKFQTINDPQLVALEKAESAVQELRAQLQTCYSEVYKILPKVFNDVPFWVDIFIAAITNKESKVSPEVVVKLCKRLDPLLIAQKTQLDHNIAQFKTTAINCFEKHGKAAETSVGDAFKELQQ